MPGKLTSHVLDTTRGGPAVGMEIELWSIKAGRRKLLVRVRTNADGRTDAPLVPPGKLRAGEYELIFCAGDYFANRGGGSPRGFLDRVPVRFRVTDADQLYHVPLLCSPWSYTTYRGS